MKTRISAIALLLGAAGCQTATPTPAPTGTFSQIYETLFPPQTKAQCSFCHSLPPNQTSNGMLSMGDTKATAYAALVKKPSVSKDCGAQLLVAPGDPEKSLFYTKLTTTSGCGGRMPLGGGALTTDQLEMVRSWIAAGAAND